MAESHRPVANPARFQHRFLQAERGSRHVDFPEDDYLPG